MAGELERRQGSAIAILIGILGACGLMVVAFFYAKDKQCHASCDAEYAACTERAKTLPMPAPEPGKLMSESEFRTIEQKRCSEVYKGCDAACKPPVPGQ